MPAKCAVCDKPPSVLCSDCRSVFEVHPFGFERGGVAGIAGVSYSAEASRLLSSVKERGQTAAWRRLDAVTERLGAALRDTWPEAALVCVPSSRAAMVRRGLNPALQLCKLVARAARLPVVGGLELVRQPEDQAGLNQAERAANLRDSMRFTAARGLDRELIIFDDVVTTGATLLEAARAIRAAEPSLRVAGFCVFAETLRKLPPVDSNGSMFSAQATQP